ncbi:MAG: type III polyketide synthase [Rhizobiales bacterium]|nr:type III polyketide synthase [Hyphomicrobiales bacterium]
MTTAHINRIATAVPPHDVHETFIRFAESMFPADRGRLAVFRRMASKSGIAHRYSFLAPSPAGSNGPAVDRDQFYMRGAFPTTAQRMRFFEEHAPSLAADAVERLQLGDETAKITHLLITCCTGLSSPGIDLELIARCGLSPNVERSIIGFMGCYAAINAFKLARHIVRSEPKARVLTVNLEMCTLHLQETPDLETILSFLLWGDGCAASLVTAEENGLALESFHAVLLPESSELITWNIGDNGFDMVLSGQVPAAIQTALSSEINTILDGTPIDEVDLWAVHPGGRTVLDAVERALALDPARLSASRHVLRECGNMSSATVSFVLAELARQARAGDKGCAMSFGPGLVAETMRFRAVGA